jgi:hypothetical protein
LSVVTFTVKDSVTKTPIPSAYALLTCTFPGGGTIPFDGHSDANGVVEIDVNGFVPVLYWSVEKSDYQKASGSGTPPSTVYLEPITPPATYTLTISTTDGGTTEPSPGSYTYPAETSVTVKAIPSSGYAFNHWELDGANVGATNPITVKMDRNHSLHAVFSAAPPRKPSTLPILVAIGVALIIGYLVAKS